MTEEKPEAEQEVGKAGLLIIPPTTKEIQPSSETSRVQIPDLNLNSLQKVFNELDDEYFEKAQKITTIELSHAHDIAKLQLQLQIEKEKRSRLISSSG